MLAPTSRRSRRVIRFLPILLIAVAFAGIAVPVGAGFVFTYTLLTPACGDSGATPADYGHAYQDVTLAARAGGRFRAFFVPGSNGAAIIIPPPYGGGRDARLEEADVLVRHGYAVLAFESRRCAGMGRLSLGYKETDEVADALAIMAAARLPELHAVIAEGGYGDLAEGAFADSGDGLLVRLYEWSVRSSYRLLTGVELDKLSPIDVIDQIAPRPILLIYGSREISLDSARQQRARAGDNADLWVVEGAGHGNYLDLAPVDYEQRVIGFFDAALLAVDN